MKTFLIILAVIAALIIITAIKATLYKQEKPQVTPMPEERVDEERVQRHLSQAIAIKTISNPDDSKVDWSEFEKFHDFLEKEYPLTHKTLKREKISQAALLYTWQGTNPDLDGIALWHTKMLCRFRQEPKMIGSTLRLRVIMTANLFGAEAPLI